jgi:acetolactate decarboxylase
VDIPDELCQAISRLSCCSTLEETIASCVERFVRPGSQYEGENHTQENCASSLYVSAPILDLVDGLLSGTVTVGKALEHGNFGLGTLHLLDGEVVVLDGVAYQQRADGTCHVVEPEATSPFMMVCQFGNAPSMEKISGCDINAQRLHEILGEHLTSKNVFTAIKVQATFKYLKVRAVHKQLHNRPLVDVTREQAILEFQNVQGYLVGFYSPAFLGHQLSVPGFHLHFINSALTAGGHVLDCVLDEAECFMQPLHSLIQEFPQTQEFEQADFEGATRDGAAQLHEAES